MKRAEFLKHLAAHKCQLLREGANHTIYVNPQNRKQATVGRHQELSNLLCKKICKQLDIPSS
ncbi:MAG: type II toxin-antitoxin system HicA family toxin [Bacteroidales bacterium]|nr:type II toxin-antitoxin system HicA family toxin [Bacteroidales bacterium]